ncbi:hypothetical protein PN36_03495 [Candidatus Thiomargarita nelsonii]|uniref:DUF4276 family protein n=1 Tax=Candidatus Thiomargarita nelsonii TaxID=1003181 RepID=A0A0A6PJF3_9GAMM|nr:hypothetical protein PN36_03495 [Candidatus Thiomargarita nelsonii]
MKIIILVEGKTERVFMPFLRDFLQTRLTEMPKLSCRPYHGRVPKDDKLRRIVEKLLTGKKPAHAVIALSDVYTGTDDFIDAADAKQKMKNWVGNNPHFYPHVAQHDFEAWLLPFWSDIQKLAGHNKKQPSNEPENVNHNKPPARHLEEIFRLGKRRRYQKPRDAKSILEGKDLSISANACPELKAFLNTLLTLCGGTPLS